MVNPAQMEAPGQVMEAMREVERELAELEPAWARAEHDLVVAQERKKLREAQLRFTFKGRGTVEDINALVRDALWNEDDGLMEKRMHAQAAAEGNRAAFRAKQARLSSMQSRLNALTRIEGTQRP